MERGTVDYSWSNPSVGYIAIVIDHRRAEREIEINVSTSIIDSPIGPLQLVASETAVCSLNWPLQHKSQEPQSARAARVIEQAAEELRLFFAGRLTVFTVPLAPDGSQFQQAVWSILRTIPWGGTLSYREVAEGLQKPSAARAVGTAVGKNPLPIFIPCHRIIGSNGSLTGFSGGLEAKRLLLDLEGHKTP